MRASVAGWGRDDDDRVRMALAFEAGHLFVHEGGFTLHFAAGTKLSGYDFDAMKARCAKAGLPVIDTRCLEFAAAYRLAVSVPEVAGLHPAYPPPSNLTDLAPLRDVAALYRAAGAEVLNLPGGAPALAAAAAAAAQQPPGSSTRPGEPTPRSPKQADRQHPPAPSQAG